MGLKAFESAFDSHRKSLIDALKTVLKGALGVSDEKK